MRRLAAFFILFMAALVGGSLLTSCNDLFNKPPIELPELSFQSAPAEAHSLGQFGSEDIGPQIELVNPPSWIKLANANGQPVEKCEPYAGGCQIIISETAPAGNHQIKVKYTFNSGIIVYGKITLEILPKITISPAQVELEPGATQQFQAHVYGSENSSVTWSASCGQITETGLYTAPNEVGSCEVTATSVEFSDLAASATVEVKPQVVLNVDVTPNDATVNVSGPGGYTTSFTGDRTLNGLQPGTYTVSASHPDYFPDTQQVVLQEGDQKTVQLTLQRKPAYDFVPHLILTNEGTNSDARETTVKEGTVITVYWGMLVKPESAKAAAQAAVEEPGVVLELWWQPAGAADYQRLARIYQMPEDEQRTYPLPPAKVGENRVRVVVDPDNQVLEANEDNNVKEWIIHGLEDDQSQNKPPNVSLSASVQQGYAPLEVTFTANASDPDGKIVKYEWDLDGNGSYEVSGTSVSASFTYDTPGTYYARVRVTDDKGATDTDRVKIEVLDDNTDGEPPTVSWVEPAAGEVITGPVVFKVEVQGDAPITVSYYINDQLVAANLTAPYAYEWKPTAADNGEVKLAAIAKDPDGESNPAEETVTVDVVDRMLWEKSVASYGTPYAGFTRIGSGAYIGTNAGFVININSTGDVWASEAINEAITTEVTPDTNANVVYVHTPKGYVYAVSLADGKVKWSNDLGVNYVAPPPPVALAGGSVWVTGANPVDSGTNRCLYALDPATGDKRSDPICFEKYLEALAPVGNGSNVIAVEETSLSTVKVHSVYFDSNEQKPASDDSEVWNAILANGVEPTVFGAYVYLPSQAKQIIRADWDSFSNVSYFDTGINHRSAVVPVTDVDVLKYLAVNGSGSLYLLDAETGQEVWHTDDTDMSVEAAPAYNPDRHEIYAVSWDGVVRAYSLTGELRFSYQIPGIGEANLTPVYLGSDVLLIARYRTLYGIDLGDH